MKTLTTSAVLIALTIPAAFADDHKIHPNCWEENKGGQVERHRETPAGPNVPHAEHGAMPPPPHYNDKPYYPPRREGGAPTPAAAVPPPTPVPAQYGPPQGIYGPGFYVGPDGFSDRPDLRAEPEPRSLGKSWSSPGRPSSRSRWWSAVCHFCLGWVCAGKHRSKRPDSCVFNNGVPVTVIDTQWDVFGAPWSHVVAPGITGWSRSTSLTCGGY